MGRAVATGDGPSNLDNRIRGVAGLGREHGNGGQAGGMLGHPRSHLREAPRREGENHAARHGMTPGQLPFGSPHDVGGGIYILSRVIRSVGSTREDHPPVLRGRWFSRSTRAVTM